MCARVLLPQRPRAEGYSKSLPRTRQEGAAPQASAHRSLPAASGDRQLSNGEKGRKGVASRSSAAIRAFLGGAVARASTLVLALRLASAGVSRLSTGKRAIRVIALAVAIPLGAFAYEARHAWLAATGDFDRGQTNASTGGAGSGAEDFASFNNWKRSVEQALKDAEARETRQQNAAKARQGADETKAPDAAAQQAGEARLDLSIAREVAKRRAETLGAGDEDKAAAGTKAASAASATEEANAANGAKRATETRKSGPFSESPLTADAREEQPGSAGRFDGQRRPTEIDGATKETDRELARWDAMARHASTYSWVTTDRSGHRWLHIRTLRYR
ncbi:MAG: hypothetical protein JO288_04705 [Hyphomicrobiales bacterium]|nr:hypothetical protein [Hyphomicrobiales bacterium]